MQHPFAQKQKDQRQHTTCRQRRRHYVYADYSGNGDENETIEKLAGSRSLLPERINERSGNKRRNADKRITLCGGYFVGVPGQR